MVHPPLELPPQSRTDQQAEDPLGLGPPPWKGTRLPKQGPALHFPRASWGPGFLLMGGAAAHSALCILNSYPLGLGGPAPRRGKQRRGDEGPQGSQEQRFQGQPPRQRRWAPGGQILKGGGGWVWEQSGMPPSGNWPTAPRPLPPRTSSGHQAVQPRPFLISPRAPH